MRWWKKNGKMWEHKISRVTKGPRNYAGIVALKPMPAGTLGHQPTPLVAVGMICVEVLVSGSKGCPIPLLCGQRTQATG